MRLEEVVNNNYSKLNENDLYILKFICSNKKKCRNISINDLADNCNVSRTTILRFTQKLGFKGYSEFKVFLRWEEQEEENTEEDYVSKFYLDLEETRRHLDNKKLSEICELIQNADRVFVYGTGMTQTAVAKEMQRTFLIVSKYFYVIEGETELKTVVSDITDKDVFIAISLSGNNELLKGITTIFKMNRINTISMTKFSDNILARNCKYNLYISTAKINLDKGRVHETTAFFFLLVDVLFRQYLTYIKTQSMTIEEENNEEKGIETD
ncbi:MurR/RpiR family transcriptional regulator [Clostridium weizhouense]|uniref:MurR/RpiR family transcriptional regulator n=1 Tax=Clostridium weizhouense TaxID=2859781 RepID=A0ABS7ASX5_9CLOT|nr:MurR/RpiR family transcriptional regulator [Clostridium weizhouense]MBW6410761.1 MurR/RpiR family transcriptional regulator [Clostridium weizhouense]